MVRRRRSRSFSPFGAYLSLPPWIKKTVGLALLVFVGMWLYELGAPDVSPKGQETPVQYFERMAPVAEKVGKKNGLFPSVMLAQSALESDFGRSQLSREYHNYFGIKRTGREKFVRLPTREVIGGVEVVQQADFRAYRDPTDSFSDYARLITGLSRYQNVRAANSPEAAARSLVQGGYATDPQYAEKIIKMIEQYGLKKYD